MRGATLTLAVGAMISCGTAMAAAPYFTPNSTIFISNIQTYCQADNRPLGQTSSFSIGRDEGHPYVRVDLLINSPDAGRPGLIYVGSHDPGQTKAQFYTGRWENWEGALFPINKIVRGGLSPTTLFIPLDDISQKQGWKLYVGYGALTTDDEMKVQRAFEAVAKVKAKFPDRQIPAVDPDHFRRVLVQENMTKNAKYQYVRSWSPDLLTLCDNDKGGR